MVLYFVQDQMFLLKGSILVLFWMSLISLVFAYLCYLILFQGIDYARIYSKVALVPAVPFLMCAPIVGWIADARCGNYRVFRVGASLLFSATVVGSICVLILVKFDMPPHGIVSRVASDGPIVYIVGFVGGIACLVTALQLGLDQMPDASSANITSFIAWFVFSIALGAWIVDTGFRVFSCFIRSHMQPEIFWTQVFSLVPVIAMSVLCCSLFLLAPKWMTIEPNCPQNHASTKFSSLLPSTRLPSIAVLSHTGRKTYLQEWIWESRGMVDRLLLKRWKMSRHSLRS